MLKALIASMMVLSFAAFANEHTAPAAGEGAVEKVEKAAKKGAKKAKKAAKEAAEKVEKAAEKVEGHTEGGH